MTLITFINFVVIFLLAFFLYFIVVLYFNRARGRDELKHYLANTLLLTRAERERIAVDLSYEETAFKRSTDIFLRASLIVVVVACALLLCAQMNIAFGYVLLILIFFACLLGLGYQANKVRCNRKLVEQMPNAIELIIHYTLANVTLRESIRLVSKETPMPLAQFFKQASNRTIGGEALPNALRNAARPYRLFELNYFVMVLILQLEMGTDTTKVLRRLVGFLRREKILQQKIRALKADINAVQWGLMILIFCMVAINYTFKPEYLSSLLASPLGIKLVIVAILLFILGSWLIQRITRVV